MKLAKFVVLCIFCHLCIAEQDYQRDSLENTQQVNSYQNELYKYWPNKEYSVSHEENDDILLSSNLHLSSNRINQEAAPYSPFTGMLSWGRIKNYLIRGKDLLQSIPKAGIIIGGKLLNTIPTPYDVFHYGKKTLFAFPQEIIAYFIDSFCKFNFFFTIN